MTRHLLAAWILLAWVPVDAAPCTFGGGECAPGVCEFAIGDCAQQNGTCHPAPTCDLDSGPVCGCNDIGFGPTTYSDACAAFNAGDVVAALGACPINCGGQTCTGNTFCQLPVGLCNRAVPETCLAGIGGPVGERLHAVAGVCTPIPTSCSQVSEPVCGCSGPLPFTGANTYLNSCVAAQNQVSIIRDGPCTAGTGGCGGFAGAVCSDPNDVCPAPCAGCGHPFGICEPQPVTCDNACAPVCACSAVDWYRNRCEWLKASPTSTSFPVTVSDLAGCGEVWGVQFIEKNELRWGTPPGNPPREFNVYRTTLTGGGPPSWNCVASGLAWHPYVVSSTPPPGETWAFALTMVDGGVEGPLGWGGSGCTERTNVQACPPG